MAALDGLRILDMTQYEAGPACTQALAWFGADVVKIEPAGQGDPGRWLGHDDDTNKYSHYFCYWNANKRSVGLDLRKPEGKDLLLRMLPNYDVFIENYGPGVIERLGLDYETLKAVHPSLIFTRIKGFGLSGPYAHYKSYDCIAQAAAGVFSVTGEAEGPPMTPGSNTGDSGTGVQMGMAILAAYVQKLRTGEGQEIEVSMQEAMTYYMRSRIAVFSDWGNSVAPRSGNSQALPPVDIYPCKPLGPNDWAFIMPITDQDWDVLCSTIGMPELVLDPRFETALIRSENRDALYAIISEWTQARTKQEVMNILGSEGVPCSAILDTRDLHSDPHLNERNFIKTIELPYHGQVSMLGFAPRMSASDVSMIAAPILGEHTDEVLKADLQLNPGELEKLRDEGIIT